MDAARRLSALTHGDPAAGEGRRWSTRCCTPPCRATTRSTPCRTHSPASTPPTAHATPPSSRPAGTRTRPPSATARCGPAFGSAVRALRTTGSYGDALRAAIELGGDTDTVAAATGALAGAVYGADAIPERRVQKLRIPLPGFGDRVLRVDELRALA